MEIMNERRERSAADDEFKADLRPEQLPFVSVIVPARNAAAHIEQLLQGLAAQVYPATRHEIVVVDNGSDDRTSEIVTSAIPRFHGRMSLRYETQIPGSYAARNKGIKNARGEVLAFTDADCIPQEQWLAAGVHELIERKADLVGGRVRFIFSSRTPNAAEIMDSRINMQVGRDIASRGVAKTANLFVWRHVVEHIGLFPEVMSGGDVMWTGQATRAGYRLAYCEEAEVEHPARSWISLFQKQVRVGRGQIPVLRQKGMSWKQIVFDSVGLRGLSSKKGCASLQQETKDWTTPAEVGARLWCQGATFLGRLVWLIAR